MHTTRHELLRSAGAVHTEAYRRILPLLAALVFASAFGLTAACADAPSAAASPSYDAEAPAAHPTASAGIDVAHALSDAFESTADKVGPSVVAIFAEQKARAQTSGDPFADEFFRRFFGDRMPQQDQTLRSMGSGVIVSKDGYVLTNNHVVAGADELHVVLADDKKFDAKLVGTDPESDVAVIRIDASDLPAAELGDSDSLRVGQWVIAVGNPFQLLRTVTAGIVSAKGRSSIGLAAYESFIQTDASINPGNSGGALADLDGRVVGINTAISSPSGGSVGIGFAIPISMARRVMDQLIGEGKVSRGYLALMPQDLDEDLAAAMGLDSTQGALVADVSKDGPADHAGVERGDVIVGLAGDKVKDSTELRNKVALIKPGSKVDLELIRGGKTRHVSVELGERPLPEGAVNAPEGGDGPDVGRLGLEIQDLTPAIARQLGIDLEQGVVVAGVEPGSAAADAGLRRGDVIAELDRAPVADVGAFAQAIRKKSSGDRALLVVHRGPAVFYSALRVP